MRKAFLISSAIVVFSCTKKENPMIGIWKVNSRFYKATCEILEENDTVKGEVLYYNDNTTVYRSEKGQPKSYFFNNIKEKNGTYIDAVSGATKIENENKTAILHLLSKDTLEVTTYILNKPLKEIWIRN
ncbi:hypothetical protein [Kordia sp.]|uniref:hypothetical protein n=1 Tax=Kordia sp. TaxID=1965332 RepID=UPI003D6A129D